MKRFRLLLALTALGAAAAAGVLVYLAMTVPNDLRADALLEEAKSEMAAGRNEQAREALSKIIQQYPRTDGAAAATVALVSLAHRERDELARAVGVIRRANDQHGTRITDLQKRVARLEKPPATATVGPPAPPKPPAAKKPAPKPARGRR